MKKFKLLTSTTIITLFYFCIYTNKSFAIPEASDNVELSNFIESSCYQYPKSLTCELKNSGSLDAFGKDKEQFSLTVANGYDELLTLRGIHLCIKTKDILKRNNMNWKEAVHQMTLIRVENGEVPNVALEYYLNLIAIGYLFKHNCSDVISYDPITKDNELLPENTLPREVPKTFGDAARIKIDILEDFTNQFIKNRVRYDYSDYSCDELRSLKKTESDPVKKEVILGQIFASCSGL